MDILKLALLGSFRIAFLASLKIALRAYTFFLSDTASAS
jgi:ABC-type transport system involved in cytochrome bd biosynthesis fused ATPase/permease subunit